MLEGTVPVPTTMKDETMLLPVIMLAITTYIALIVWVYRWINGGDKR